VALSSAKAKSNAERWERGVAALSKCFAREGHCCPLQRDAEGNFKLGKWVSVQRSAIIRQSRPNIVRVGLNYQFH
jgi:hypothetical protein